LEDRSCDLSVDNLKIMRFKFENLVIWQKAMDLGEEATELSNRFPKKEIYNLSSQFRRAADSIAFKYFRRFNWAI
jgi:hypothetical protein